jgi:hypothetical protein
MSEGLNISHGEKEQIEKTITGISDAGHSKKEITAEKIKEAEKIILDTLGMGESESLGDFDEKLKRAIKSLPRYQQIQVILEGVEKKNLPYELFKVIKKEYDDEQIYDKDVPKDGTFVMSMKEGPIECTGRASIASTYLQEHKINHVVVTEPGHALIIIEQSPDTLIYFDANNNLYFSFPKSALLGYEGTDKLTECELKEYTPRDNDFYDGIGSVFPHFVVMSPKEGVGRRYLGNVAAALGGNKEFETSGIAKDKEKEEAIKEIEKQIYGENKVLENFDLRVEGLVKTKELQITDDTRIIHKIFQTHPVQDDFVDNFTKEYIDGDRGKMIPYIRNTSPEKKKAYTEKVWDTLQKQSETVFQ